MAPPATGAEVSTVSCVDRPARVAVVGGGLAGLSAAVRLVRQGVAVELFEARRRLGGRAGSFHEPHPGPNPGALEPNSRVPGPKRSGGPDRDDAPGMTDYGQHVSLGCCTALAEFVDRTGLAETFEPHGRLTFIGPDGWHCTLSAAGWLPAPLHLLPSLLRFDLLTFAERWHLIRVMWAMTRLEPSGPPLRFGPGTRQGDDESVGQWLRRHGQSSRAIDRFWSPVLVSALGETLDHASLRLSRKVIVDGLLASRRAYEMQIPRLPLAEIFDRRLGCWLESRGATIHRLARVARIEGDSRRARSIVLRDNRPIEFDAIILAVPWDCVAGLLSPELLAAMPELKQLETITPAAITTVHLRYDRPITDLPHAVLVGRLGQWLFAKSGNRYQVVVSASHRLVDCSRDELGRRIERELAEVFPAAASAKVLHRRVVVQPRAVFSACPGIESLRPPQATPIKNLALAGDWTATGWPATMESAVRSGRAAADVILKKMVR